ncbi:MULTISPECIES: hypothetical protein [Enterococcus]|uniref:hypothetical protein n=1 Tax=Enterococcus TaxID=1350 RepID=UPI00145AB594|nr:hypothetical protein [Enterococcus faecium]EHA4046204.1 hypothetical protein [Enterococcus faecalis]MBK0860914.1 hypothetical protein [Enterococcus faecium]QMX56546.1 hypothetical protein HI838_014965 [Enterococcus faecium]QOJ75702.1 hypothetical protein IG632_14965 [Enterococcus faecium]QTQ92106.1 hypothetical protein J7155_14935 [Enterococcus faecium]
MTTLDYIKELQKKDKNWFLEGKLIDSITLEHAEIEEFISIKIESFERIKDISIETIDTEYFYENFKFRNYQNLSLVDNAELSVIFDNEKETVEAILTTKSGIYKFLFDIKIENIYKEA